MGDINGEFNEEIKITKENQSEILEIKKTQALKKPSLGRFSN